MTHPVLGHLKPGIGCIYGCKCVLSLFDVHAETCNIRLLQVVLLVHVTL